MARSMPEGTVEPVTFVEAMIRGLVRFAAARPQLSRIMMQEATSPSDRLRWLVDTHVGQRHADATREWNALAAEGTVPPIDGELLYHTVIGSASLLYANAPEAELMGVNTRDPELVERHADALVALFLPSTGQKKR